ncbi:outer membrane beta-barrel protein [Gemmatimonadota bacterium]
MGRRTAAGLLVAVLTLFAVPALEAQNSPQFELTAFAGGALFISDLAGDNYLLPGTNERYDAPKMDNGIALGGHLGFRFGKVSLEGTLAFIPSSFTGINSSSAQESIDTNVLIYGASLLYTLPSQNQLMDIFLVGGVGAKTHSPDTGDGETNFGGNVGLGLRVWVTPTMALRFEGRDYISPYTDGNLQNDLIISAGLSIAPGQG